MILRRELALVQIRYWRLNGMTPRDMLHAMCRNTNGTADEDQVLSAIIEEWGLIDRLQEGAPLTGRFKALAAGKRRRRR